MDMNPFIMYIVENFALLCIVIALGYVNIQNLRYKKRESIFYLILSSIVLLLSIVVFFEQRFREIQDDNAATIFAVIGYILRPVCLYFFIGLADSHNKKIHPLLLIPLGVNLVIYILSLFRNVEFLRTLVFYYENGVFYRGTAYLNFFSHIISAFYLGYVLFISFKKLKGQHLEETVALIICSFFIIVAVTIESILTNQNISILNITIACSIIFYYLFTNSERNRLDPLTGLYNREVYYKDIADKKYAFTGVIMFDMNGLKYINDHFGHDQGDKALVNLGDALEHVSNTKLYSYRLGGDEFVLLAIGKRENELTDLALKIKKEMEEKGVFVSYGIAIKEKESDLIEETLKIAEAKMYKDKEEFYKSGRLERRGNR